MLLQSCCWPIEAVHGALIKSPHKHESVLCGDPRDVALAQGAPALHTSAGSACCTGSVLAQLPDTMPQHTLAHQQLERGPVGQRKVRQQVRHGVGIGLRREELPARLNPLVHQPASATHIAYILYKRAYGVRLGPSMPAVALT